MQLTHSSDYALRALIYVGLHPERKVTIREIANSYGISANHLMKIVHRLAQLGFLAAARGRTGGLTLGTEPAAINLGEVVQQMEPHFQLAECMDLGEGNCMISPSCQFKHVLEQARVAFMGVLRGYTLADVLARPESLRQLLFAV